MPLHSQGWRAVRSSAEAAAWGWGCGPSTPAGRVSSAQTQAWWEYRLFIYDCNSKTFMGEQHCTVSRSHISVSRIDYQNSAPHSVKSLPNIWYLLSSENLYCNRYSRKTTEVSRLLYWLRGKKYCTIFHSEKLRVSESGSLNLISDFGTGK